MRSTVSCSMPGRGGVDPDPSKDSVQPGRRSYTNVLKIGWQRPLTLLSVASLCFLAGCATPPPPPAQPAAPPGPVILTDPVPGLVKYRVDKGDRLALSLRDGSGEWLTFESLDGDVIRGKDGISVAIADIHELEILPERASTGIKEATAGILGMSVIVPLSIVLFPVALPAVLIIDWDKPKHWNDGMLCRVVTHPEFYGYTAEGFVAAGEKRPALQDVRAEFNKRKPDCGALARGEAEFSCAKQHDNGPAFEGCFATNMARSDAGLVWIYQWSGDALCRVHRDPGTIEYLASAPEEERKIILERVSAALQSAKFDCPKAEPLNAGQATPPDPGAKGESQAVEAADQAAPSE